MLQSFVFDTDRGAINVSARNFAAARHAARQIAALADARVAEFAEEDRDRRLAYRPLGSQPVDFYAGWGGNIPLTVE